MHSSMASVARRMLLMALLLVLAGGGDGRTAEGAGDDEALWQSVRAGGHVLLLRHALAPGTGDPPGFRLDDCATQRNLDEQGREQARAIGEALRERGLAGASVMSSRWCRCLETARLLGLGAVEELAPLDSFFGRRADEPAQTAALRDWLAAQELAEPVVLVTHQVNITALTGIVPRSGELVVAAVGEDGTTENRGRFALD